MKNANTYNAYEKKLFNLFAGIYDFLDLFSTARVNNKAAIEIIRSEFNIDNLSMLDIGCGTGTWSSLFLPYCSHILCMDFAEKILNKAKKKITNSNAEFDVLSAYDINKYGDKSFDIVTASYVFHGMNSLQRRDVLNKIKRIARKYFFGLWIPFAINPMVNGISGTFSL